MNEVSGLLRRTLLAAITIVACLPAACGSGPREPVEPEDAVLLEPGLELQRRRAPVTEGVAEPPIVTLLYIDPSRFAPRLLTAAEHGSSQPVDDWAREFDLVAATNASMYLPNLRSTGLMIHDQYTNNPALNPRFGGILAFDPVDSSAAPVSFAGTECDDFDLEALRSQYRTLVQNYRLLDCDGHAIPWEDRKLYSSAAIGLDRRRWLVFAHSGAPCRTSDFARWLAEPDWGVVAANFVEGGADASLYVRAGGREVRVVGSYEGTPATRRFRPVPNVIGIVRRGD